MQRADFPLRPNRLAVVGFAFRFPGGQGDEFWRALCEGRDLVTSVHPSRWSRELYYHPSRGAPGTSYTLTAGSLGELGGFDAGFFGISPREAAALDPQQRLLLELSWEAFESAGIPPSSVRGSRASVHIGFSGSDYGQRALDDFASVDSFSMTGICGSIAANRLSYFYDLRGPSMAVDTACSSSLVALHQASQSLLLGEAELAIAGAVNLHLHPYPFVAFSKATMLSKRGVCSPFDAQGDGYVRSEGGAIVLLKRLEEALAAGNPIFGVIAGTNVNCDGKTSSLTVPSSEAQSSLLSEVYSRACIDPSEIDYLEAHGTGTAVGDPIEARALAEALGKRRARPLPIGSVKSNLGHLETAAGMAGLVKALFCLRHRLVPPSIHYSTPNANIPFGDWNLEVVNEPRPLDPAKRLVIGVNSFGFGGANAHVVLESYSAPAREPRQSDTAAPFFISARSDAALKQAAARAAEWLESRGDIGTYDAAYSAAFHRDSLEHRAIAFGADRAALVQTLADFAKGNATAAVSTGRSLAAPHGPAFLYSGNGSQWPGMGQRLAAESPVFADALDRVNALWREHSEFSLREALVRDDIATLLEATEYAQPLLFAVHVGLTELLADWGIRPVAVAGHSVGEIAAAWASGALSLEQAVHVVYARSHAQARTRGAGGMCAVALAEPEARARLHGCERLTIAALNSPRGVTIAGPVAELEALEAALTRDGVAFRRLKLDYAFHTAAMDGIEAEVRHQLAGVHGMHERIPFYSTVTGEPMSGEALDAGYWWRNIREPVRFAPTVSRLVASGVNVFVEIGPNPALRSYVAECLSHASVDGRALVTMSRSGDGHDAVREKAFQVLIAGCSTDLERLFPEKGNFVELPHYPWQRDQHWHSRSVEAYRLIDRARVHPLLGYRVPGCDAQWQSQLDAAVLPALGDHRVGGQLVVPAAAFAEMALAAAADFEPAAAYEVEELEIRAPLLVDGEHSRTVRFALDAADRRFTIKSRERLSAEPWQLHVVGKLGAATSPGLTERICPPSGATETGATHYALTAEVGLQYGPAFQQVAEVWRDGDAVCASLAGGEPELISTRTLDASFQLLVHALRAESSRTDVAFVPVRIERLIHQRDAAARYARLEVRRRNARSVLADCTLYDERGEAFARADGVRFRAMPLRKSATPLSHLVTRAVRLRGRGLPHERLAEVCRARVHEPRRLQARERYFDDVEPLLEAMLAAFAKEALASTPAPHAAGVAECVREAAGDEQYPPAREIWAQLLGDHPDHAPEIIWLGRVGLHLPDLLAGRAWQGEPFAPPAEFAVAIAEAVKEAQRARAPDQRLRLAWLDAGHSGALERALQEVDPEHCDCVVLCAEPSLLEERKALASRHPGTLVRPLEPLPPEAAQPFDLVVLEDGFGALPDAHVAAASLRRLVIDGGVLLAVEPRLSRAALLASRMLAAAGVAPRLPVLRESGQWQALLSEHGFGRASTIADLPELEAGSQLIIARAEPSAPRAAEPARRWLVVGEPRGMAAEIGERLRAFLTEHMQTVESAPALPPSLEGVHAIVYLAGLGTAAEAQAARCASLGQVLETLATREKPPALTIVTAGAQRYADEAPFAGYARVALNEYRALGARLVDLAQPEAPEAMARELAAAPLAPDAEDELVLTSDGPYAVRVQVSEPTAVPSLAPGQVVRLELPPGGQVKNLAWTAQELGAPRADEIEIEVRAAGLNFRDVMFAMGHLSDEAMENGFAGPTLGMELAGVVRATGPGTHSLRAGDEVIAFAPAAFATRVVTSAAAVVKKPAEWSFEAATTIPATFLTAYYALHDLARLQEGERVLIHGGAGGVGLAAIQIAQMAGAEIFATASEGKRDVLRLLGVDHVLDSRSLAFGAEIMDITQGEGVDVVLNSLAGEAMMKSLAVLKPFGRFLELGKRDFYENTRIGLRPLRNNIAYFAIDADQLMRERPEQTRRLMQELMVLFRNGRLKPLPYRAFAAAEVLDAVRFMQQSKHIGKIVLSFDPPPAPAPEPASTMRKFVAAGDATYVVTGGTRGFGFATAQWLAEQGAKHLVLVGRNATPDAETQAAITALEARGARIRLAACDVADRRALEALLDDVRRTMPPLRGVVHAAALISDGLIRNLQREQIDAVFAPKVLGASNLHELTRGDRLDFFVLYSSATTVFGNPGQAAYVGANRYLEVLAESRRAQGLPALCVAWGPIADAGYLARQTQIRDALEARMGGSALPAAEALELLGGWLAESAQGVRAVVRFDRGGPGRMLADAPAPKFQPLLARFEGAQPASTDGENLERLLEELDDEALATLFTDIVKKEIAEILRMPAEKLEDTRPLQDLGLDSLMGVELMTAVEARFGVNIPVMAMTEVGTIERLVKRIVKELRRRRSGEPPAAADPVLEQAKALADQHAAGEVAAAEVEALARELKVTAK